MKKIGLIYILIFLLIASCAILMNIRWEIFAHVKFSQNLHIIIESANSLLMFMIFITGNILYLKTKDQRLIILAGGMLIASILNLVHIFAIDSFPFDLLSIDNIQNNPNLVYLLFANLMAPLSIALALVNKQDENIKNFRLKIYSTYFFIFLSLITIPFLLYRFLPFLKYEFEIIVHALEFINYTLYIMLALIIINIRYSSSQTFFPIFTLGLVISGLGGLFYINPLLIEVNEIFAHVFQAVGLFFIWIGISRFQIYASFLRFKDELATYFCLMLIAFYIVFVSLTSALFKIIFPPFSAYVFVEFLLAFQFIIYLMTDRLTQPINNIIDTLETYIPGERPIKIMCVRNDEIEQLAKKINDIIFISWQKIEEVSSLIERERSVVRIFETMRRIPNTNIIKDTIIGEISKAFNPDVCFIALYDSAKNKFYFDRYSENLPSKTLVNFDNINDLALKFKAFNKIFKNNIGFCFANVDDYIAKNALHDTIQEKFLKKYEIKACCNIPIYYASHLLGYIVLEYIKDYKEFSNEELLFLNTMATQIGIAINQSNNSGN